MLHAPKTQTDLPACNQKSAETQNLNTPLNYTENRRHPKLPSLSINYEKRMPRGAAADRPKKNLALSFAIVSQINWGKRFL